jgi:hypothetical protein
MKSMVQWTTCFPAEGDSDLWALSRSVQSAIMMKCPRFAGHRLTVISKDRSGVLQPQEVRLCTVCHQSRPSNSQKGGSTS